MSQSSISNNSIIYRAITASSWTNEQDEVSPSAFLLKEKDDGELSVLLKAECVARICAGGFNTCYGEILLQAEKIRNLNLEIEPDPLPKSPYHAVILNLPMPDDFKEAERMATLLTQIVEKVQRKPEKYRREFQIQ
ncbi:MAG: hypothetical protein ABI891_04645 [Acidobacteriota bacterium]